MKEQKELANKNIRLYVLLRVFAKRVFLPLAAIYFVQVDHFTIKEIGLLAAFSSFIQLFAEVPTGYFADRMARVTSIRIGASLNICATLLYVFVHQKHGVFLGQGLEALGYSFMSGAGEALIHDSLVVKKQEDKYSKIVSRAQSMSLLINAGLIALVPFTYRYDPRAPFLLGTAAYLTLLLVACSMHDVGRKRSVAVAFRPRLSFAVVRRNHRIILFGLLFGIVCGLFTAPSDMYNLALKALGIKPELLGFLFSGASIIGALMGPFIHILKRLPVLTYMLLDASIALLPMAAAYSRVAILMCAVWIINMSFWRYRKIIYQDHLLTIYPGSYKASLLSTMNFTEDVALLWMPIVIAGTIAATSLSVGLGITALGGLCIIPLYLLAARRLFGAAANTQNVS